jgi:hypothetical protein
MLFFFDVEGYDFNYFPFGTPKLGDRLVLVAGGFRENVLYSFGPVLLCLWFRSSTQLRKEHLLRGSGGRPGCSSCSQVRR